MDIQWQHGAAAAPHLLLLLGQISKPALMVLPPSAFVRQRPAAYSHEKAALLSIDSSSGRQAAKAPDMLACAPL